MMAPARFFCAMVLAWPALVGATDQTCANIEGNYAFLGTSAPRSAAFPLGMEPNVVLALLPGCDLAYEARLSHYRVLRKDDRWLLELHDGQQPRWRIDVGGEKGKVYCRDGALVVERRSQERAGSVYEYSQYQHVLRPGQDGELEIATEISGEYRTTMMTWPRATEQRIARFPRLRGLP